MTLTPGQIRTANATAARKRIKHERMAAELREAGYTVFPPREVLEQPIRDALAGLLVSNLTAEQLASLWGTHKAQESAQK